MTKNLLANNNTRVFNFPADLEHFTLERSLGGGTESTFKITNTNTGQSFVLKLGAHPDALKAEILCNALYRSLGVPVPESQVYNTLPEILAHSLRLQDTQGIFQVSEYLSDSLLPEHSFLEKIKQHFVAYALLGNIDVAKRDNFIGETLIDAGANFLFRSLGEKRVEKAAIVSEIESLTNPAINLEAARWFSGLTNANIKEQVILILKKQESIEKTLWGVSSELDFPSDVRMAFLQNFCDRLDYLVTNFCPEARLSARIDRKADEHDTAAGVLTCTFMGEHKEPYVLLSKRVRHAWWDNFGGKSDANDNWLYETACREVAEESNQQFIYTHNQLLNSPFHDLISEKNGKPFVYRMYIAIHDYVDPSLFVDNEHTENKWVSLQSIIAAMNTNRLIIAENERTIAVGEEVVLYPPLYTVLSQKSVLDIIHQLEQHKKLSITRTQSALNTPPLSTSRYRLLQSPESVRHQTNQTMMNYAMMLKEFKKTQQLLVDKANLAFYPLSQSELHLNVILGDAYQDDDIRANVAYAVEHKVPTKIILAPEKKLELIGKLTHLIETEKNHPEQLYFYHACDDKVAFTYQVYTMMHQLLQANDDWFAFRGTSQFFAKFDNIAQLIAHYSENGTKTINNNDPNFQERAISTNLFLFGNHANETSNCIVYLLLNTTRRDLNLDAMLNSVLQPLGASPRDILLLTQLYERYRKNNGAALYQISMSPEEARNMSYAAGDYGRLSTYHNSHDVGDIITQLRNKTSFSDQDIDFFARLQARLLVPPHQILQTKEVRFLDMNVTQEQTFNQQMQRALQGVVRSILTCRNEFNADYLSQQTPLLHIQSELFKINNISDQTQTSPLTLAVAIIENNAHVVQAILKKYPEFKKDEILYPQYSNFIKIERLMRPLEMMVYESALSHEVLAACFGEDWFFQVRMGNLKQLTQALAKVPEPMRLHQLKKMTLDDMQEKIIKRSSDPEIDAFLKQIPEECRLEYLKYLDITWIKTNLKTCFLQKTILSTLSALDRTLLINEIGLDFLKESMETPCGILYFLNNLIPNSERMAFIQALGLDWIQKVVVQGSDFRRLLDGVSPLEYPQLIQWIGIDCIRNSITNFHHLGSILHKITPDNRLNFCASLGFEWLAKLPQTEKQQLFDYFLFKLTVPERLIAIDKMGIDALTMDDLFALLRHVYLNEYRMKLPLEPLLKRVMSNIIARDRLREIIKQPYPYYSRFTPKALATLTEACINPEDGLIKTIGDLNEIWQGWHSITRVTVIEVCKNKLFSLVRTPDDFAILCDELPSQQKDAFINDYKASCNIMDKLGVQLKV